jgi:Periplasmic binding protein
MGFSRETRLTMAGGLAAALTLVTGCGSVSHQPAAPKVVVPGATGRVIAVGGFGPVSGDGGEQAGAARAYFRFVNDHGGIYGRRIAYRYLNDHGDPALAPSLAHQLVQQDAVFAMFGEGDTAANLAVATYLNAARIPDVFPNSNCDCLNSPGALPYTFGWQLSGLREGKILGWYVARARELPCGGGVLAGPVRPGRCRRVRGGGARAAGRVADRVARVRRWPGPPGGCAEGGSRRRGRGLRRPGGHGAPDHGDGGGRVPGERQGRAPETRVSDT